MAKEIHRQFWLRGVIRKEKGKRVLTVASELLDISLHEENGQVGPPALGLQSQFKGRYLKKFCSLFHFSDDKAGLFGDF